MRHGLVLEFVLELLGAVCEAVAAIYPPLQAALLVLGALLFGFCSYVFFDTANPAGGIVFACLARSAWPCWFTAL